MPDDPGPGPEIDPADVSWQTTAENLQREVNRLRRQLGGDDIAARLAEAIRDYYGRLTRDSEREQLVEVLDEHGIDIDLEEGPRG